MSATAKITLNVDAQKKKLKTALSKLDLNVSEHQTDQMIQLMQELMRWNKTYNLTAIRDSDQALVQHLFDSLSVVKPLSEYLKDLSHESPAIMDVGSGSGFPGLVLAIAMPQAQVVCVDAVEKKISFIRQIKGMLGLKNLDAVHARVEDMETLPCQIVISRAFSSLKDFVQLAGKHVARDGKIAAMKGKTPVEEMQELSNEDHWAIDKTIRLVVPEMEAERCLIWIEKRE